MSISTRFRRAAITVATIALCAAAALAADAAASPIAAAAPIAAADATGASGYHTFANVAYVSGGTAQQILDLYVPRHSAGPVPLIVYVHGGGWSGGDKSELQGNSGWQTYLSDGFALASIDYTLSGTAVFPQAIYDVNAAIRFLRANAGRYHLDGSIGLWGESAGGQLVALAGATCGVSSLQGKEGVQGGSSCAQAVVDGMGPTDLLEQDTHLLNSGALLHNPPTSPDSRYLGCTDGLAACPASTVERANPITYLTSSSQVPPYLIVHGDADPLVPHWESEILFNALTSVCANVTFDTMHGQGHTLFFTGALNPPYPAQTVQSTQGCQPVTTSDGPALTWDTIATFFHAHLR